MKGLFLCLMLCQCLYAIKAQSNQIEVTGVFKKNIKTVKFRQSGVAYGYPVIELNGSDQLLLEFDDLNDIRSDYYYSIIHCDRDRNPESLNPIEYIKGFETDEINDYQESFNTLVPYRHYQLLFPNERMGVLLSGQYLLYVFEENDKEKPVLALPFYVVEKEIEIEAKFIRSSMVSESDFSQEAEIKLVDSKNMIFNPISDIHLLVFQNCMPDPILKVSTPDFIKGNVFEYKNARLLSIKGGNEYRYFNTKNLKSISDKFASLSFNSPYYIFELLPAYSNTYERYSYTGDINGHYLVTSDHCEFVETESEYVLVDFIYHSKRILNSEIYIDGEFTNGTFSDINKTEYDQEKESYFKRMYLKQGFYNYRYVLYDQELQSYSVQLTEGNYYETENDYLVLVYYKPPGVQYEKIIGYKIVNTFKNL